MTHQEYLLSYGVLGDFGRFFPALPFACRRSQRAVVRSHRGLELATVLGEARPGHAAFLPNTTVGSLLRLATPEDDVLAMRRRLEARRLADEARALVAQLELPVEVLDAEMLLDGEQAVVHHVRWAEFDPRDFVSKLSRTCDAHITLLDLTGGAPARADDEAEEKGCGRPDCGSEAGGGCGSGGGCSTCGLHNTSELKKYFAGRREQMEHGERPASAGR